MGAFFFYFFIYRSVKSKTHFDIFTRLVEILIRALPDRFVIDIFSISFRKKSLNFYSKTILYCNNTKTV